MAIDNPEDNSLAALWRLVKRLASANPLNNGSVDRGALTIRSPEGLVVGDEATGAEGGGSAKVFGLLNVLGKIDLLGRLHLKGSGRVISSEAGDTSHSMQLFYEGGIGYVVSYGIPMQMRAWDSIVSLNENGLSIQGGGGIITMSEDSTQIIGPDGDSAVWTEYKDGNYFIYNLPTS
ncbi:hypothetical protein [Rathayibacter sp. VKM Ac-2630]|uniref:hypothetical protein n=1 Tax=Rathayibacter sp. VKM Ac-2630 TaxID=1938617 RepID=UPI0009CC9D30|nr:hypothetical protein [Rathayibacter sp. VKM Ac-2630]OOB91183.1 hypothetical protein B0T42_07225 [Rathayibacter sp. VKM Ac-2630]